MKLSQLQQAYANPNVRKMLNLIAASEGVKHGYNTLFGNQQFNNLGAHPNIRKEFTQTDGRKNYTTAAGRYQFLNGTWIDVAKQYGLRDFSPQNQDLGAIALLAQNGALPYLLKGDFQTAINKSGGTWASLPSSTYKQGKRSWDFVNKQLGINTIGQDLARQSRTSFVGDNWADFTKQNAQQERTAMIEGDWNQFTSQSQLGESDSKRTAFLGNNWADFVNQGE